MDENVKTVNCTDVQYGFFMYQMQYIWKKIVLKTAQSVFYLRNHVLTMLLFLSKMIYVVSDQNHNLLLCSEKDLRNSQLGKFGILPT